MIIDLLSQIFAGSASFYWGNAVMILVGLVLIALAVIKEYEPVLLLPIGVGCILANLGMAVNMAPGACSLGDQNFLTILYCAGIKTELFPLLIFVGVGAMIDFTPLLAMPQMVVLGAAGQFGIYATLILATLLGFKMNEAASIGVIGAIDGPTAIFVTTKLAPELLGPIAVAAYTYMSLVPLIQPPIMRLLSTHAMRSTVMSQLRPVSKLERILFPIVTTFVIGILLPPVAPLVGMLMLGNLMRESGVVERLADTAANELINICTIFLSVAVGASMNAESFLNLKTIYIIGLGVVAFGFSTAGGMLLGDLMWLLSGHRINPLIGSAGVSAVPMAARVSQKVGQKDNPANFLLMHAMGPNVAGVIGTAVAAGIMISLLGH